MDGCKTLSQVSSGKQWKGTKKFDGNEEMPMWLPKENFGYNQLLINAQDPRRKKKPRKRCPRDPTEGSSSVDFLNSGRFILYFWPWKFWEYIVLFGTTPVSGQGLFLALHSGITSGGERVGWRTHMTLGIQYMSPLREFKSVCKTSALFSSWTITLVHENNRVMMFSAQWFSLAMSGYCNRGIKRLARSLKFFSPGSIWEWDNGKIWFGKRRLLPKNTSEL